MPGGGAGAHGVSAYGALPLDGASSGRIPTKLSYTASRQSAQDLVRPYFAVSITCTTGRAASDRSDCSSCRGIQRPRPSNGTFRMDAFNGVYSAGGLISQRAAKRGLATFKNPIARGADPWVIRHGGYYYWCLSENDLGVAVYRSTTLTTLGEKFVVWRAPASGPHCAEIWAPELHHLDGRWYIYVAASNGANRTHRMIVLECQDAEPTGTFSFKSELYTGDDFKARSDNRWAIDGTILEHRGARYMLWSGWRDERDEQWLYIAPMSNPWTLSAARVQLCANDDYAWEHVGESRRERGLNEGPQVLQRDGRTFVIFSCSGSWEPTYKLGLLELRGGDPLNPRAWQKHASPVFMRTERTCGVGHCSFTVSPDGAEDWIVYHAKISPAGGWQREIRAQRFDWDGAGLPHFGRAVDRHVALARPSGETTPARVINWPATAEIIEQVEVIDVAEERGGEPANTTA